MINNVRWLGALGAVYVACAAVGTAQASPDDRAVARGPGVIGVEAAITDTTAPWLVALNARSEALNREYGLGDHAERRQLDAPGPNWLAALNARSEALNRKYGLGDYGETRAGAGLAWSSAARSAVASLAVGVLLGAGAVSIRYRHGLTLC